LLHSALTSPFVAGVAAVAVAGMGSRDCGHAAADVAVAAVVAPLLLLLSQSVYFSPIKRRAHTPTHAIQTTAGKRLAYHKLKQPKSATKTAISPLR